jgi:Tripartite ATP-independent periplasmic transporters, DctQ component
MSSPGHPDVSDPLLPDEPLPQRISRIFAWVAGAIILFGCAFLITIDVITRYFFKRGMVESFEISGYALAASIGLGMAFTVTQKANIRVDILLDALPDPVRIACDLVASLALALIAEGPFRPKGNLVAVPTGPGIGMTLDRDRLAFLHRHFVDHGPYDKFRDPDRPGVFRRLPLR